MQISVAPKSTASRIRLRELLLGDLVGIGGAAALTETAEGAADDADVGEVDVAVDDERHPVAGELDPQLVGGRPHLLDHLGAGLGEERRSLVLAECSSPSPALAIANFRRAPLDPLSQYGVLTRAAE